EPVAACRVERVEEHRLVLHLLVAVPPEQPGNARGDAVEQPPPREDRVAELAEEVLARDGDRAPEIARGPVDDREPSQHGICRGVTMTPSLQVGVRSDMRSFISSFS